MKMAVFWVVASIIPDNGGSKHFRNVGKHVPEYTAQKTAIFRI
jgi:hypothetical protein